jgi:hypothetical protein
LEELSEEEGEGDGDGDDEEGDVAVGEGVGAEEGVGAGEVEEGRGGMHAPWVLAASAAARHELTALATAVLTAVEVDWDRAAPPVLDAEAEAVAMAVAVAFFTSSALQVAAAVELLARATAKPSEMAVAVT